MDHLSVALLRTDGLGRLLYSNQVARHVLGYTTQELDRMQVQDILQWKEHGKVVEADAAGNYQAYSETAILTTARGNMLTCSVEIVQQPGETGDQAALYFFVPPAAVPESSQEHQSPEQYRLLFQKSPIPMWIYDIDSLRFMEVNQAAIEAYGYSRDEFLSMTILDIRPEKEKQRLLANIRSLVRTRETTNQSWKHRRKDGTQVFVNIRSNRFVFEGREARLVLAHDITQSIVAEEALKTSNERYRLATQASYDAIWDADLRNQTISWGEGFSSIFGYQISGHFTDARIWENNIHPEDREEVLKKHYEMVADKRALEWTDQYRFIRADGSIAWVTDRGLILRDEKGTAYRIVGAMRDITEQKYQEDIYALELKVFEESASPDTDFRKVVDDLMLGIERVHPGMKGSLVLLAHDDTIRHFSGPGLPAAYLDQLNGLAIGPEAGSCGTAMYLKQAVIVSDIETNPLWTDGRVLARSYGLRACWSVPIINSAGKVLGSFAIYYDRPKSPGQKEWNTILRISNLIRILMENHQAVEQIKVANQRYNTVAEASHDLIWDWNMETGEIYRDPTGLQRVYGITDNEIIRRYEDWLDRVHPDDRQKLENKLAEMLRSKTEGGFDMEYRYLHQSGEYVHIYDRGYLMLNKSGEPARLIGASQNISMRKHLEQQLLDEERTRQKEISRTMIDTQEKERADIGKELHDNINQVLTTTKLYLELADADEKMKSGLLRKSSENIMRVINEIRHLSRSLMPPSLGDIGLVDSVADLAESINVTKRLKLTFSHDDLEEGMLEDNKKLMIFRIIQEACTNILRHAAATSAWIDMKVRKQLLEISIRDNGCGFHPEATKKGSGLYNIKNRVYLFDGAFRVDSAPGCGSELLIKIPITQ